MNFVRAFLCINKENGLDQKRNLFIKWGALWGTLRIGIRGVVESFLKKVSDMGHTCPMSFLQVGVMEVSKTNTFTLSICVHHHSKCISQFLNFAQKLS